MNDIKVTDSLGAIKKFEVSSIGAHLTHQDVKESSEPKDKIKVKFDKFVNLVATHDFEDVMKRYADEDIILSTNLLTDLASAHEEIEDKPNKIPVYIAVGVLIGIVITYLITRF